MTSRFVDRSVHFYSNILFEIHSVFHHTTDLAFYNLSFCIIMILKLLPKVVYINLLVFIKVFVCCRVIFSKLYYL